MDDDDDDDDDGRLRYMRGCVAMTRAMVEGLQGRVAKLEQEDRAPRDENAALRRRVGQLTEAAAAAAVASANKVLGADVKGTREEKQRVRARLKLYKAGKPLRMEAGGGV